MFTNSHSFYSDDSLSDYSTKLTCFLACAALDTFGCINDVRCLADFAAYAADRAFFRTKSAFFALVGQDIEISKRFTYSAAALLQVDMFFILISKIMQGGENRIGCCLPKAA
jgi:hypothetical protein